MMATWRSDLDRILHVFNVRSIVSIWLLLTLWSQTELVRNTQNAVSDVRHGVANIRTMAPDVRNDAANTPAIVSDVHHNTLKSGEGANSDLTVRICTGLSRSNHSPLPRPTPSQWSRLPTDPVPDILI